MVRSLFIAPATMLGLLAGALFTFAWKHMPASWLFDDAMASGCRFPHPHSLLLSQRLTKAGVILLFSVLSIRLMLRIEIHSIPRASTIALILKLHLSHIGALSLLWLLCQIAAADVLYRLIPDAWSLGVATLGALRRLSLLRLVPPLRQMASLSQIPSLRAEVASLLTAVLICTLLWLLLYALPLRFTGIPALGMGDVKLCFALALAFPLAAFIRLLVWASLLSGLAAAILLLTGKARGSDGLPFALFLGLAGAAILIA